MTAEEETSDKTNNRVLIVDDHPIVRQGLKGLISQATDLIVCGEAETIFDALKAIEQLKPDIIVVDISLKGESGVDLIKDVRIRYPDLPVLTLSMYDEAIYAERVLCAGARGYVTKEEAAENVLNAIRQVLNGQIFLSERMSAKMLSKLVGGRTESQGLSIDRLSDRELQVFELHRPRLEHPHDRRDAPPEHQDRRVASRQHQGETPDRQRHRASFSRPSTGFRRRPEPLILPPSLQWPT